MGYGPWQCRLQKAEPHNFPLGPAPARALLPQEARGGQKAGGGSAGGRGNQSPGGSLPSRRHASSTKGMAEKDGKTGGKRDELAESLAELFNSISATVHGELQGMNSLLDLLEKMNLRVVEEYNSFGDVASGLRIFVEQLNKKNGGFEDHVKQIEAIDKQVTEFEAVVSMLDKYVYLLESKVKSAYSSA